MFAIALAAAGVVVVTVVLWSYAAGRRSTFTAARIHVDDLATGRVPGVCFRTGGVPDTMVQVESAKGSFQPWWLLLLFLGPIGIIAIVALWALAPRHNSVGGILPISREALDSYNRAVNAVRRTVWIGLGVGIAAIVLSTGLARDGGDGLAAAIAIVGVVLIILALAGSVVGGAFTDGRWVDVQLDGSGRWATVDRVHPDFVAAAMAQYRESRITDSIG